MIRDTVWVTLAGAALLWVTVLGCSSPTCEGDDDCPAGKVCRAGSCTAGGSGACDGVECPSGTNCVLGTCAARDCAATPCREGQICQDEVCVAESCVDVTCPTGEACAAGACHPTACTGVDCGAGVCIDGRCLERSCADVTCGAGEACIDGVCRAASCEPACAAGEECVDGSCRPPACEPACAAGERCEAGDCIEDSCAMVECAAGQLCRDGACVPEPCALGLVRCGERCVDLFSDPENCRACGTVCATGPCRRGWCPQPNDDCENAVFLDLGAGPVRASSRSSGNSDSLGSCDGLPDAFWRFHLDQRELVYAAAHVPASTDKRILLGIAPGCGAAAAGCEPSACFAGAGSHPLHSSVLRVLEPGDYVIVVDIEFGDASSWEFNVLVHHVPVAGVQAGELPPGTSTLDGTTVGAASTPGTCGAGSDRWYPFTSCPGYPGGTLEALACGELSFPATLQLVNGDGLDPSCAATSGCAGSEPFSLPVSPGDGLHVLFVDGEGAADAGPYSLAVTRP